MDQTRGRETDELLSHDYDGIREFDNPLPMWWLWTFFAAIIFSFVYWVHYTVGGGQTQLEELAADLNRIKVAQANAPRATETPEELLALFADANLVASGKAVYDSRCAACHGVSGEGLIGPNLTDNYWIHGKGEPQDVLEMVRVGSPEKGMPGWEQMMSNDEVISVAGYVFSLKGTNPSNAKAPQGELVSP